MDIFRLRPGDSGDNVAHLHSLLELQGLEISTEERKRKFFGPSTSTAVKAFQKAHGISPSSEVSQQTADLLATLLIEGSTVPDVTTATSSEVSQQTADLLATLLIEGSTVPDGTTTSPIPSIDLEAKEPLVEPQPSAHMLPTNSRPAPEPQPGDNKVSAAGAKINQPNLKEKVSLDDQIAVLTAVLTDKNHQQSLDTALRATNGDISQAMVNLKDQLPEASLQKITLAHSLAILANYNAPVVKAIAEQPSVTNLRDVALNFNVEKLAAIVDSQNIPANIAGTTEEDKKKNFAVTLQHELFTAEPTAVLQRMVQENEVSIADDSVRTGVANFLNNQPDFNIRTTSIYTALKHPEAFKDIPKEQQAGVVQQLKNLQRVQAISPTPETVSALINANLTSAFQVAQIPESVFLNAHDTVIGKETALQVYTNAINSQIRNEHALVTMRETVRGTGLAIMDNGQTQENRLVMLKKVADEQKIPVPANLENLFGDMDYCECDDCLSVYSPASYFVELLQYLRNNNLDPTKPDPKDITNTSLEKLFRRRPDLGCLELTCENTFTVLPYIDLVNEVMESFIVYKDDYDKSNYDPNQRQTHLDTFNVEDETTSELLAQPQHTNYDAYCILKNAVYPFMLPYHQAIDAIRIFLKYLGTSRYELQDTYRDAGEICANVVFTVDEQKQLQTLHVTTLNRAVDAEFLSMTQEEYIILTKEAFWPKRYFEITQQTQFSGDDYRQKIGVKPLPEYYGYIGNDAETDMFSTDEDPITGQKGLTFVKKQFLRRTGILYVDLVELLKTQFINPNFPQGKALTILESIRFSYRFLQTLVDNNSTDPFAKLVEFLEKPQPLVPLLDAMLHPDPCQQQKTDWCMETKDLRNWVYCYFERIGQLIVLESGEGPQLPIEGQLLTNDDFPPKLIGTLHKDGTIVDKDGTVIGLVSATLGILHKNRNVTDLQNNSIGFIQNEEGADNVPVLVAGPAQDNDGNPNFNGLYIKDSEENLVGYIDDCTGLLKLKIRNEDLVTWTPAKDTCNLDKVRLLHLDGSILTKDEYDRIQRFIRLWRKLGWTIDETDKAIVGLSPDSTGTDGGTPSQPDSCDYVGFDVFQDDCSPKNAGTNNGCNDDNGQTDDWDCPELSQVVYDITPDLLHQLVAVRKVLDLTGLPLIKLLTFWADISTVGEKSLYTSLFLTHNLLGIDKVFKADMHGNYLTQSAKITDHIPVLMAALNLKADDISAIMQFPTLNLTDVLTLHNLTVLYRHSLLAKTLHVKVSDIPEIIALFDNPLKNADQTLELLETWGKIEDAGFTFRQLDYIIRNYDDLARPLAPSLRKILQLTKTLYDGLNNIDQNNPDVLTQEDATTDLVRSKASLLFEQSVVEQIISVLEGTTIYSTNARANLTITIPDPLSKKLKYSNQKDANPPSASIQVTGILTDAEKNQAKTLSNDSKWAEAIDRVGKQALHFFNDVLFGIFSDKKDDAIKNLLAGDINVPANPQNPTASDQNTALQKRFYFLQSFLPFLRQQLEHRLIIDTLSAVVSLPKDVTDILLSDILVVGTPAQSALSALEKIKETPAETTNDWKGYLIPSIDDSYTFIAISDNQPVPLLLDGQSIPFPYQQEDPSNVWSSDPIKLKSGKLYLLEVTGQSAAQLQWKTATSPKATIPASALLPNYSSQGTEEVFTKLYKAAFLVNGFNLSADEVSYWQAHGSDFDGFDFNAVTLKHWQHLQAYTNLRNNLPRVDKTLLDLFQWAGKPDDPTKLSAEIAVVTNWKQENIDSLLKPEHFDLNHPEAFRNEVNLVKLQKALQVADKIAVDIDSLFNWAKPGSKFWDCHQIAEDIRKAIRARYDQEDWEKVVKPLNDQLREDQKLALISYLLVQQDLIDWGILDADSLFEFFLIDVQMDACMQTSRIKQAISSVQLFVQRCFLGLEDKQDPSGNQVGVPNGVLDRDRWNWMQSITLWEANRKVFLYPENWIDPQLRDDKSPFYKELESELLQKDINSETVQDALKNYLFKVDEVANMKVVGLFVEQGTDKDGKPIKLHIFSKRRNAPYFFYYRYFDITASNWYPWEKVQVDIPSYDLEKPDGSIDPNHNGTYLIPVVWNKRPLIFFPQFVKKTVPPSIPPDIDPTKNIPVSKPIEGWQIKIAWSEYRNRKWTQKQVSSGAIDDIPTIPNSLPDISQYEFVPIEITSTPEVVIGVYSNHQIIGAFHFPGSQITQVDIPGTVLSSFPTVATDFHYVDTQISSVQTTDNNSPPLFQKVPYFDDQKTSVEVFYPDPSSNTIHFHFSHTFVNELLGKLNTGNLDDLFDYYLQKMVNVTDSSKLNDNANEAYGDNGTFNGKPLYNELKRSYSLYNWEVCFHSLTQIIDRLLKSQQFEQAIKMCQYIFNPLAQGTNVERFWQFPPFKVVYAENILESLFFGLQPNTPDNTPDQQINEWRDNPFQPHVIARSRPSAYMKWVVMKYIEILIAWGDYLFRQDTIESLNQATQIYVLASHIYGPRGQKIPKRGKVQPQTYNSLLDKWDAFGNAIFELELVFPFSNQTPFPIGVSNGVVGLANIFGFATTLYFCIPDNPQMRALGDTIDDRLFKIRHCENIEGVFQQLPLFEPPLDPALLVQAAAQGLSLSSVLNDLNSPMPNYRFYYLLQKALELCTELKALGNAFLSANEKGDGEALSRLRAKHESSIQNLVMEVRKQQLDEANSSLDALQQNRKAPASRMQYYLSLIGQDISKVPDTSTDFSDLPNQIETPITDSGLVLINYEKEEMDKASDAAGIEQDVGHLESLASTMNLIPGFSGDVHPFGIGLTMSFGGSNLGAAAQAIARWRQNDAADSTYQSTNAGRKAGFLRQLQDRVQQANNAGYEIKNIDKQILTQQIRIGITNQEITNQQKQIDNAQEVEDFLRNKYTNQQLYIWMGDQLRTLYKQAYTLAYDLAKKAEKVYRFERGLTTSNFIQFGYFNAAYDGLLAGEQLYIGLKQLEAAYQEKRGYDFEITKPISLRQINPMALLQLRETGTCEFALPEVLFDMDRSGDYMRRIKSVAMTIPCVVGPYTSLNCTLRLLEHKFRCSAIATSKTDYPEKTDGTEDRFTTFNVPITAIAVSTGQNDSGVFELNFRDERYLPFEGAGAISKWRLELPSAFRQFDYDTITDVVMQLRYTAVDGGDKLKLNAGGSVTDYIDGMVELSQQDGLFAAFDLKHDFSNEWYKAMNPSSDAAAQVLMLDNLNKRLPIFTKWFKILATDIYLFTSATLSSPTLNPSTDDITFNSGASLGTMHSFVTNGQQISVNSWQLNLQGLKTDDKLWLVVRYVLLK
ncbi:neuraminidase-like domain-containing protein [uncultured Nostoc sp.]|uniref:Tc toxin subunit A-related protein n=1 Tax=uncultured Nostoc sp. TaxID=340711 RepID=UPI0035C98879